MQVLHHPELDKMSSVETTREGGNNAFLTIASQLSAFGMLTSHELMEQTNLGPTLIIPRSMETPQVSLI